MRTAIIDWLVVLGFFGIQAALALFIGPVG